MSDTDKFKNMLDNSGDMSAKIKYQINKAREIMCKHKSFKKLSLTEQLEQSITICIIAQQTSRDDLQEAYLSTREKSNLPFSINNRDENPN